VALDRDNRRRLVAGCISLVIGTVLMGAKFVAYRMTGSSAIFSDALESIVNIMAAAFAIGSILFAGRPADRGHPYGHGKVEFFSAAFEGGLIAFAAIAIAYQAIRSLVNGVEIREINTGLLITAGAGMANLFLGLFLVRTGRRTNSLILIADGKHVLSDFWTTVGVLVGLAVVRITELPWLDPVVALIIAINLARTGFLLVRHSAKALLDEEDTELLQRLLDAGETVRDPGIIRIHHLRAIRVGRFTHVDAHIVVPEFWSVGKSHDLTDAFEARLFATCKMEGELVFHTDPCKRIYCEACELADCAIREHAFIARPILTLDEATQPDAEPGVPPPIPVSRESKPPLRAN
jgi:cation diffusion facilitator family transporter